jgi:hypothetical protein
VLTIAAGRRLGEQIGNTADRLHRNH